MNVEITCSPAYALAYLRMQRGEQVFCEPGSMVAMSMGVELNARIDGNPIAAALRNVVGSESFFLTRLRGQVEGAWVAVAPRFPGDIAPLSVTHDEPMNVQSGSYLAHEESIDINVKMASPGEFLLREGATLLRVVGNGTLILCSYGGMQTIDLRPGDQVVVDTSHLVAWSDSLQLKVGPLTGYISSQITSEGLVGRFTAVDRPGRVIIQTRGEQSLRGWLFPDREMNRR
jgi:uncharacterized protein (TIGR00266 family)